MNAILERIKSGLAVSRWPLVLVALGVVLLWRFDVLGSLVTDFLLVAPVLTGAAFLISKVLWDSWWAPHGYSIKTHPQYSLGLFATIFLGLCLLVG